MFSFRSVANCCSPLPSHLGQRRGRALSRSFRAHAASRLRSACSSTWPYKPSHRSHAETSAGSSPLLRNDPAPGRDQKPNRICSRAEASSRANEALGSHKLSLARRRRKGFNSFCRMPFITAFASWVRKASLYKPPSRAHWAAAELVMSCEMRGDRRHRADDGRFQIDEPV